MHSIFARKALLADGWSERVRLCVEGGLVAAVEQEAEAEPGDVQAGIVIPGLVNAHSHAFQRALVGRTEQRSPATKDNFWTWRSRMYALAQRIDRDALTAIARQAYCEMLSAGYTGVVEFHYLHSENPESGPGDAMLQALATAAGDSGIRLTYVPVLYERAGFDQPEPNADQRRFATTLPDFEAHYRAAKDLANDSFSVGIGAHSLRAASAESLAQVAAIARADQAPMHLHIAEQQREVDQCLAALETRPVRWLLRHFDVDERWCLVHATHLDAEEITALAGSGAVVCLCPSTEANLGDGLFPLQQYLEQGGRIAIGSDSHVSINPFEELRWLEYGQRLVSQTRNVAPGLDSHTGRSLFELAVAGGALAGGRRDGGLRRGACADLVILDDDSPMLVGHETESLLDALVFSGFTLPIDRVMSRGQWCVVDGHHTQAEPARREYARTVARLYPKEARA
ncbi:MAG TPA: formimidoylglutamate deiminase [Woeseiaceae bacterium]|nr:formimidoylglutamate deiminase [Woeseiaceae bacterium]